MLFTLTKSKEWKPVPNRRPKLTEQRRPAKPTEALPGSEEKIKEMRRRVVEGEELFCPADRVY